jgi:hypothetical protein
VIHIAVIGLGPWGLAAVDRLVAAAIAAPRARRDAAIKVTAIDPAPGPGVHDPGETDLLLLNTVAGQIDSFGAAHFGEPPLPGALPFLAWARRHGFPDATADAFLPRTAFARYLEFVLGVLQGAATHHLELAIVRDRVVDIEPRAGDQVRLGLGGGSSIVVDRAFLCTGHGLRPALSGVRTPGPAPAIPAPLAPYPIAELDAAVGTARSLAIAGMGLVAVDVVAALTEGRGGRFARGPGGALVYHPSGREPLLFPFSRSGIPFSCRPVTTPDLATRYEPVYCTAARIAALRDDSNLHLEHDVLSLVFAEMRAGYGLCAVALGHGSAAAAELRRELRARPPDLADKLLERAVPAVAAFQPRELVLAERLWSPGDPGSYRDAFVRRLAFDLAEARKGEAASPFKTGVELLRVLRHVVRAGVEHDRLAPASRALLQRVVAPRISQLIVGPPVARGEQWLALIDAGILRLDLGPAPDIRRNWTRARWRATTTSARGTASTHLDRIVRGHLDPDPPDAARGLWQQLYAGGLCAITRTAGRATLRIDPLGHLIDASGLPVATLYAFGIPTEGATYFNHYLPSPRSRAGAFERLRDAIAHELGHPALRSARIGRGHLDHDAVALVEARGSACEAP